MAVTSTLWYLKDLPLYRDVKPYIINLPLSQIPSGQRTNQECHPQSSIRLNDIRLSTSTFTLDEHGFEISTQIPPCLKYEEFNEADKVRDVYCQVVKEALRHKARAEVAHVLYQNVVDPPAGFAVVNTLADYTPLEAFKTLQKVLGKEKAPEVWAERRVQIIQAWRPLRGPVIDWPLAVCDVNSVDKKVELIATDNVWSYALIETYNVLFSPRHAWYYIANQNEGETLLFKGFDNAANVSTFCPHAAFQLEQVSDEAAMRESVECAILLIHPKS